VTVVRDRYLDARHPRAREFALSTLAHLLAEEKPHSPLIAAVHPVLVDVLREGILCHEAVEALGNSRDPLAVAPLIATLTARSPWLRQDVVKALTPLADGSAIPALEAALRSVNEEMNALSEYDGPDDPDDVAVALEDLQWLLEQALLKVRNQTESG
jgi:HEAT repeat protein